MEDVIVDHLGPMARLQLTGRWTIENMASLQKKVNALRWPEEIEVLVDGSGVERLDTNGAWLIEQILSLARQREKQVDLRGFPRKYLDLLDLVSKRIERLAEASPPVQQNVLERIGRKVGSQSLEAMGLLTFIGEATIAFLRGFANPRRIRFKTLTKIVEETGVKALGIVGLLSFLLGIVIAYQGGVQLRIYGANIFIVELVTITMLRELAPLIAAIIIAGRTGSAYTAEIGTMKVTEEIDALQTLGIGPFDLLVLPKVFGLMLALPLLTVFADALGVFGGMVMAKTVLDVSFFDFLQRVPQTVSLTTFVVGVVKAPAFAIIISMVGCHQGFQVAGGADSVGRQTTVSVVQSIFLVIVADAAFSIVFNWMGI